MDAIGSSAISFAKKHKLESRVILDTANSTRFFPLDYLEGIDYLVILKMAYFILYGMIQIMRYVLHTKSTHNRNRQRITPLPVLLFASLVVDVLCVHLVDQLFGYLNR